MPTVENDGVPVFYEDAGSGPAVVLGHSFLCTRHMWQGQVPTLSDQFRVVNIDFRGHGRSGPVERPFSLYDAVSDTVAVLDHLRIEAAVWCGLSIGGMVALRAALTHRTRVAGLVLLDTDAGPESATRKLRFRAMGFGARLFGIRPFAQPIARLMFGHTTRRDNLPVVEAWKRQLQAFHIPSLLHVLEALVRRDSLVERLSQIAVPALVLVGEEDRSLPPTLSRRIHENLRDSTFVQIPAAGHLSALEQPERVAACIRDFLVHRTA